MIYLEWAEIPFILIYVLLKRIYFSHFGGNPWEQMSARMLLHIQCLHSMKKLCLDFFFWSFPPFLLNQRLDLTLMPGHDKGN